LRRGISIEGNFKMKGIGAAAFGALGLAILVAPAQAAIVTYDVDATIAGGGTLMGTFSVDNSTPANPVVPVTALSLTATPGIYQGGTFGLGSLENLVNGYNDLNGPNTTNFAILDAITSQFGGVGLGLTFPYPGGGAIATTTLSQFGEATYDVFNAGGQMIASEALSGTVTPVAGVPEPSTWAMMLVGFAGLSFAGYRRTRARPAALLTS
jgi:hypothetical protein